MFLTKVVPLTKISPDQNQIFSYFTSKKIKEGGFVIVPLKKRKVPGIVLSQEEVLEKKLEIKRAEFKLRPIAKVILKEPLLEKWQIELGAWISKYYLSSLGKSLSLFLPRHFLKKIIKEKIKIFPSFKKEENKEKSLLILSSIFFPEKEIKKAILEGKQILFLVPNKSYFFFFKKKTEAFLKREMICFFSTEISSSIYKKIYQEIKNEKIKIIFGIRSALFAPFSNLGLIIIFGEEDKNYKSKREPYFEAKKVAKKLASLWNADLILISPSPSLKTYFEYKNRIKKSLEFSKEEKRIEKIEKVIFDMKTLKKWEPISPILLQKIKEVLKKNGKVLLFVARKGESTSLFCQDCGWIKKCKNCEAAMIIHEKKGKKIMVCHHCGFEDQIPEICQNCQSWKLKAVGVGAELVEKWLNQNLKGRKILRLDRNSAPRKFEQKAILKKFLKNGDILISTSLIFQNFSFFYQRNFLIDLVGTISLDPILALPEFQAEEIAAQIIQKLLLITKKEFLWQTFFSETKLNWIFKKNYLFFLKEALKERKKFSYPPFSNLIKLTFLHKNEKKAKNEALKLKKKLNELKNLNFKFQILGPAPGFISKIKGKYIFKILIKFKDFNSKFKSRLLDLASSWKIDVDPKDTL